MVYYSGKEITQFLEAGISKVKKLLRHFKKLKIAAFSSYADSNNQAQALQEHLFPIFFDGDIQLLLVSHLKEKVYQVEETCLFPIDNSESTLKVDVISAQANNIVKNGVNTLTVDGEKYLVATIVKDDYRYQFIGGNQRNNMFE